MNETIINKEIILANRRWGEVKIRLKALDGYLKDYDLNMSKEIFKLSRNKLRVVIGLSTGHGCCNKFLFKINKVNSTFCRFCIEGKDETINFSELI